MVKVDYLKGCAFSFFDVETTGLNPKYGDRICEAAILKVKNGKIMDSFSSLINPERSISAGAYAVNRITPQMLEDKPLFKDIAPRIISMFKGSVVVCHNAPFDLGFLREEFRREDIGLPDFLVIDTLALARRYFNFWRNNLGDIAASLGIKVAGCHRASSDVKITMEVFSCFAKKLKFKGIDSLDKILAS